MKRVLDELQGANLARVGVRARCKPERPWRRQAHAADFVVDAAHFAKSMKTLTRYQELDLSFVNQQAGGLPWYYSVQC